MNKIRAAALGGFARRMMVTACLLGSSALVSGAYALDTALDNVSFETADKTKIAIKRIEFTGTNLTQDEITKLFTSGTPLDEKKALIAKLQAAKISIPEYLVTDKDSVVTIKDFNATNVNAGKFETASIAGVQGDIKDANGPITLKVGSVSAGNGDFASILATASGTPPTLGKFSLQGLEVSGPDKDTPATAPGGNLMKISVASVTLNQNYDGAVPLKGTLSLKGVVFEPPQASSIAQQLSAFGYTKLDMAMDVATDFNPTASTLSIDNLLVNFSGIGSLGLKAKLGAIDKSAFTNTKAPEQLAALAKATISSVELAFVNAGIVEKGLDFAAKQQGKTADALKAELAAMAGQMVPALLGGSAAATKIGAGLAAFVAAPTSLTITATPKSGSITAPEIMQLDSPAAVLEKVDVVLTSGTGTAAPAAPAPAAPAPQTAPAPAAPAPQAAAPAPAAPAPAAKKLAGIDAWNTLIGNSLTGKNDDDETVTLFVLKNGSIKQQVGDDKDTGKWAVKGEKICVEFPDDDEETCYKLSIEGKSATFLADDGSTLKYEIVEGNPARL